MPRIALGFYPTPLNKLERLSKETGVNIYIKRDDLSGFSQFGGNKMRKLEFLLGDAITQGCDTIFTYGATQSNHAMQTATAARKCGLNPVLFLRSVVEPKEDDIRANLLLDTILGAEIHITADDDESKNLSKQRAAELEGGRHKCYDIPVGGASDVGCAGFIRGYIEMRQQMDDAGIMANYLFAATGSGGTIGGLAAAKSFLEDDVNIVGIIVGGPKPDGYEDMIASLATRGLECIGINHEVKTDSFKIDMNYWQPGYEQPNELANAAIKRLARTEGIFTDPVYSGKGFGGMLDYIENGKIPTGSTVVFWHTGGATALFAEPAIIGSLSKI